MAVDTIPKIHEGHNVKRIRQILGIKQDALAIQLDLSQQAISQLEQKETLDAPMLDKVAKALGVTAGVIRNLNEKATFNIKMEAADYSNVLPIGRKIEKIRRLRGMTQTELGGLLGISKQAVSKMEQTKQMDNDRIKEVANALGVTADTIRNFNEEATFNIISNTYHDLSSSVNYQLNPIEKIMKLYDEKIKIYERMLKEKNELIEKLINEKK